MSANEYRTARYWLDKAGAGSTPLRVEWLRAAEVTALVEIAEALTILAATAEAKEDAKPKPQPPRRRVPSDSALSRSAHHRTAAAGAAPVSIYLTGGDSPTIWVPLGQDIDQWVHEYVIRILHRSPRDVEQWARLTEGGED